MIGYQLRQREYLLQISRAMTSRLDLPSLLRQILTSAAEIVGAEAGLIALVECRKLRLSGQRAQRLAAPLLGDGISEAVLSDDGVLAGAPRAGRPLSDRRSLSRRTCPLTSSRWHGS